MTEFSLLPLVGLAILTCAWFALAALVAAHLKREGQVLVHVLPAVDRTPSRAPKPKLVA